MSLNKRLSELILDMKDNLSEWYELLIPADREEVGEEKDWSVKDEIFHNMVWADRRITILETLERGETWTNIDYGDYEEENRTIFEEHKSKSWDEAQEHIDRSYKRILDYIDRTSEGTLLTTPEGQEREIWHSIANSFVLHPLIHIWGFLVRKQDLEKLNELFGESFAKRLLSVNDSKVWQAGVHYNLACVHALTGKNDKAIGELGLALSKNPQLKEWAGQDSDLESIRKEPDFQTLVKIQE